MRTETLAVTGFAMFLVVSARGFSALGHRIEGEDCFHRGISFALLATALMAVLVGGLLAPELPDLAPLAAVLAVTLFSGLRMSRESALAPHEFQKLLPAERHSRLSGKGV